MNGEETYLAIFNTLSDIKKEMGSQSKDIQNLREELTGPGGRITNIEARVDRADSRQWWHSAIILPVVTTLHMILHKLGVSI